MRKVSFQVILLLGTVSTLSSCSSMLTSSRIEPGGVVSGQPVAIYSLPRGLIEIEGKEDSGKVAVTVKEVIVPDTRNTFRVDYTRSWLSADAVRVKTTSGLLDTVSANADDRTSEAVVNLARSLGSTQTLVADRGGGSNQADEAQECVPIKSFKILIDPHRDTDHKGQLQLPKWLKLEPLYGSTTKSSANSVLAESLTGPWNVANEDQRSACESGLCTRSARPVRVRINAECKDAQLQDAIVYLPNEQEFTPVRLERDSFADKCFGVKFKSGMIEEVRLRNASAAENLARLPESVLRALVSIPADLMQLRVNYSVQRRDFTAAELSRLQAEQALRDFVTGKAPSNTADAKTIQTGSVPDTKQMPIIGQPPTLDAECQLEKPSG